MIQGKTSKTWYWNLFRCRLHHEVSGDERTHPGISNFSEHDSFFEASIVWLICNCRTVPCIFHLFRFSSVAAGRVPLLPSPVDSIFNSEQVTSFTKWCYLAWQNLFFLTVVPCWRCPVPVRHIHAVHCSIWHLSCANDESNWKISQIGLLWTHSSNNSWAVQDQNYGTGIYCHV
jgi:hypothetical protein